ncbi:hypothetical protein DY78_GL000332 [Lactiplantibacillus fabifermentans DSM 21115]|uniref:Uncharacterized protein n=1 Tax=Lactiplantibacillus fabifermentans DSM 21115 TaxID=1413187 RepID=A0A0R2NN08_9LACO|nr:hypothetical protein DY78_GL000332 [Lactiplantibacillus fabifermentans DSM 21115]
MGAPWRKNNLVGWAKLFLGVVFFDRRRVMAGQKSALGTALWPEVYPTARPLVASSGHPTPK